MRFRATYHPVNYIENKIHAIFPNLECVVTVFKADKILSVTCEGNSLLLNDPDRVNVQKWRSKSVSYSWMRPGDFPWIEMHHANNQLEISDEHEHRMLLLCFVSPEDKMKDLIALCFPKNTKFFGLQKELQDFTTDEKAMVGEMLHKMLGYEYQQTISERESLLLMNRFQQLKDKKQSVYPGKASAFEKYFHRLCHTMIRESEQDAALTFEIAPEGLDFLAENCSDQETLRTALSKAVNLALMLEPDTKDHTLERIHFEAITEAPASVQVVTDHDQKVADMLSRYEEAASRASALGLAINGKIVAQYLTPAVSPPAISESLKKHAARIEKLLKENPHEWKLIRNSLKPVRELDFLNVFRMGKPA